MATTKSKPRPEEEIDVSPRAEAGDQFFIEEAEKKAKSFSDIKPKIRPDSDKYKGRTYDIYSVEVDGKETNVIEFKDGKRISTPQIRQMFEKYKSASEPILGKQTSQEISNFLEKNNPTYDEFIKHFTAKRLNEGGMAMDDQMEMAFMQEGGLKDEGGEVDPESGNDVPIGSTKKEVRDDIPAMLSEGEFVFPADVVRYIGLENLMRLRQNAKMGLKKMEAMGQMGNSEEATIPDDMPFDMADLIIVTSEPEEDKLKEMAQGGVIQAQTGTFVPSTSTFVPSTGIGGYQQSVFQNQPQVSAPFIPPSSVAPPTPAPSPAGGYIPKFITNQTTPFDDGSLAPKTNTGTTDNTGTTGTTDDFVPTVDDVYTQKEYFNPETGETRIINFYNNNPINEIPEGFVLKETYKEDETDTTDLESTSVESTQVVDDGSDKQKLVDIVNAQQAKQAEIRRENFDKAIANPLEYKTDLIDLYATFKEQQALANTFTPFTGGISLFTKPFISANQAKLEGALATAFTEDWRNNEAIQAIDNMTFKDYLANAFSSLKESFTAKPEDYIAIYDTANHPLGGGYSSQQGANSDNGYGNAFGMLSSAEQQAYDNAVKMGNVNAANHYAIINHHRNLELERGEVSEGTKVNLAGTETSSGSNNDDTSSLQELVQANAERVAQMTSEQIAANEEARARDPSEGTTGDFAGTETI